MALATHPRLLETAQAEAETQEEKTPVVVETPEVPVETVPEPASEPVAEEESVPKTVAEEAPDHKVYLDSTQFYREIERLERENPDFRNAIRTKLGRQAKREYQPKVADLEARLAEREAELQRLREGQMSEDEIKERLLNDPEFRRSYGAEPQNPQAIRERAELQIQFEQIVEQAEQHLTPAEIAPYKQAVANRVFDFEFDANGRPIRQLTPSQSMLRFQSALNTAVQNKLATQRAAPPPPPAPVAAPPKAEVVEVPTPVEEDKPKANAALAQSTPDLTANSTTRVGGVMTLAEARNLPPPELVRLFPTGIEDAVRSGKIQVE